MLIQKYKLSIKKNLFNQKNNFKILKNLNDIKMKKNALDFFDFNKIKNFSNQIIERSQAYYKNIFLDIFEQACKRPVRKLEFNKNNSQFSPQLLNRIQTNTIMNKKSNYMINSKQIKKDEERNLKNFIRK